MWPLATGKCGEGRVQGQPGRLAESCGMAETAWHLGTRWQPVHAPRAQRRVKELWIRNQRRTRGGRSHEGLALKPGPRPPPAGLSRANTEPVSSLEYGGTNESAHLSCTVVVRAYPISMGPCNMDTPAQHRPHPGPHSAPPESSPPSLSLPGQLTTLSSQRPPCTIIILK